MAFTIKKPKSSRFFRYTFGGFGPQGRNAFEKFFRTVNSYIGFLGIYLIRKINFIIFIVIKLLGFVKGIPDKVKVFFVKKLIWSRGKLGRPIATTIIMSVSLMVFFVGEFLSGSEFVVKREVRADYLQNNVDIIARKETAVTEIPDIRKRTEPIKYTVEGGDTLSAIGEKFKVSVDALKYVNNLTDNPILRVGQDIDIPPLSGLVHTVKSGDTINSIAARYEVPAQAIADFNYILDTSKLTVGTELAIPGAKVPEPVLPPIYSAPTTIGPANFGTASPSKSFCVWPTTVRIITQYYSWYHNGVDIATPWSGGMPPLFACTGGTVIRAGWDPFGLGLHIRIDHGNGYETVYGHMSRLDVAYGQRVGRGQVIGLMGNTGRSTGPHVHFMVKFNGVAQNPLSYTQ